MGCEGSEGVLDQVEGGGTGRGVGIIHLIGLISVLKIVERVVDARDSRGTVEEQ